MEIGLYADTHGLHYLEGANHLLRDVPGVQLRTVELAQQSERLGYHSIWFPDHVCMPITTTSKHKTNVSGTRAYQPRHNMLDAAVTMGAVATRTKAIKLATSVLIAPYRGPLSDARQFATVDVLSGGRLILGVGAGWLKEEFDALNLPYAKRGEITEECIEIYKRSWTDDVVDFHGTHYNFANLSMDPKPVQDPRPPIVFGSVVPAGARRAARHCDGLYVMFLDTRAQPERYAMLQDEVRRELSRVGRDERDFAMLATVSTRITAADDPLARKADRPICTGTADQVIAGLGRFAEAGYSHVVCFFECPSGDLDELAEQVERVGQDVLPAAKAIPVKGGWKTDL